jgi:TonB family protein
MKTAEDFEFEALLQSVVAERVAAEPPAGLAQRLLAHLENAATQAPARAAAASIRAVQFRDFGILNDGRRSRRAFVLSLGANLAAALVVIVVGSAVKQAIAPNSRMLSLVVPVAEKTTPPAPQPKLPPPITPNDVAPPITRPAMEAPPDVKPITMPDAKPSLAPPAPKAVTPPPAPRTISLANANAASIANNDAHPTPVRIGRADSPLRSDLKGPAVSSVNLGAGMPGMPAGNNGSGPPSKAVRLGNGAPNGTNLNGKNAAPVPVVGLGSGIGAGNGAGIGGGSRGPVSVQIAPQHVVAPVHPATATTLAHAPVVTYVPKPVYSEEAKTLHIEGDATVRVVLMADGKVQMLGLGHGLGHGLDQSALNAASAIRFTPATDSSGKAVDFPTTVTVHFLIN